MSLLKAAPTRNSSLLQFQSSEPENLFMPPELEGTEDLGLRATNLAVITFP